MAGFVGTLRPRVRDRSASLDWRAATPRLETLELRDVPAAPFATSFPLIEPLAGERSAIVDLTSLFSDGDQPSTTLSFTVVDRENPGLFTTSRPDAVTLRFEASAGRFGEGSVLVQARDADGLTAAAIVTFHVGDPFETPGATDLGPLAGRTIVDAAFGGTDRADVYRVTLTERSILQATVVAERQGSRLDAFLKIAGADGAEVSMVDDTVGRDPSTTLALPAGVYFITVGRFGRDTGLYSLDLQAVGSLERLEPINAVAPRPAADPDAPAVASTTVATTLDSAGKPDGLRFTFLLTADLADGPALRPVDFRLFAAGGDRAFLDADERSVGERIRRVEYT
ncbi:MAG: hypothetical protein ACRDD1_10660, partial [Planctomycetia bacterium]